MARSLTLTVKNLKMIVWLTQLGLSVAVPLALFVWLAVWLMECFGLGLWVLFCGIGMGLFCAIDGLRTSLKAMERMAQDKKEKEPPPASFQDHD